MKKSSIIQRIMFDYETLEDKDIRRLCRDLAPKILRWIGANHPDNRTRKIFYEQTGIAIGEGTVINQHFIVFDTYKKLLEIGKRVAIASNVTIICDSAPNNSLLQNNKYVVDHLICSKKVVIKDDVWIGAGAIIMPGVTLGKMSIIGAGAVITKDVSDGAIVAGIPGRVIRKLKLK